MSTYFKIIVVILVVDIVWIIINKIIFNKTLHFAFDFSPLLSLVFQSSLLVVENIELHCNKMFNVQNKVCFKSYI